MAVNWPRLENIPSSSVYVQMHKHTCSYCFIINSVVVRYLFQCSENHNQDIVIELSALEISKYSSLQSFEEENEMN